MNEQVLPVGDERYRRLGLIGNPFLLADDMHASDSPGMRVAMHSQALGLMARMDELAEESRPRPLWLQRAKAVDPYYGVATLTETMRTLIASADTLRLLPMQVGLEQMRGSRVRGVLGVVAEMVIGPTLGRTLGAWSALSLSAPDESLPEWIALAEYNVADIAEFARREPEGFVSEYFGEVVLERFQHDVQNDVGRVSGLRENRYTPNPEEEPDSEEFDADDPFVDSLIAPEDIGDEIAEADAGEDPDSVRRAAFREYVVAYTRANLSPVVARALLAFHTQGTWAAAQEVRMTKAPKKTLGALLKFARSYWRRVIVIFTRFEAWENLPQDLRLEFLGAFTQLKWVFGDNGIIAFMAQPGLAPEVEETFAGGITYTVDIPDLSVLFERGATLEPEMVERWIASASLPGFGAGIASSDAMKRLVNEADGDIAAFAAMAGTAIEDAAARELDRIDDAAVAAGIAARPLEAADSGANA